MNMIKSIRFCLLSLAALLLVLFLAPAAAAQENEDELSLRLSRDFGYSSGTGKMQGRFSMLVRGPEDLARVVYFIDGEQIGEQTGGPFRLRFSTDSFSTGLHTLSAIGYTSSGQELRSNDIRAEFVTAEQGFQSTGKIVLPLLAVIFGAILLSAIVPALLGRNKGQSLPLGAARSYTPFGGAICPKCQRPFGMHLYGLNMLTHKFDRCPYCGRWSFVRRASPEMLRAAEEAELEMAGAEQPLMSEEERLRKELEDSRFQDI